MNRMTAVLVLGMVLGANPLLVKSQPATQEPRTATIRFYAPVTEQSVGKLLAAVDSKIQEGNKRLVILISSPGGSVFAGLSAYHYLRGVPAEIVTHNFGSCDSIATVIYCAGHKRYSVPQGRFLLHGVSANFAPNVPVEEAALEERLKVVQQEVRSIAAVIAGTIGKPVAEIQDAIIKRTVLNAEDAREFGLVQEIKSDLYQDGTTVVPIVFATPGPAGPSTNLLSVFSSPIDFTTKTDEFVTRPIEGKNMLDSSWHESYHNASCPSLPVGGER